MSAELKCISPPQFLFFSGFLTTLVVVVSGLLPSGNIIIRREGTSHFNLFPF